MVSARVSEKAEKSVRRGHPWVFSDEIIDFSGGYENGSLVRVCTAKGKFLGTGFVNDNSKIRIRLISENHNDRFDNDFYYRRLKWAVEYRKCVMGDDFSNCRIIHGEADRFPGLTVDRFENVLVTEVLSLGIEKIKTVIYDSLIDIFAHMGEEIDIIYERNDSQLREKEGMEQYKGFYLGESDGVVFINENGIKYKVDYINGQKTGFFLDQKYNRLAIRKIADGKRVLDCFTHTGAFALNAAAGGAKSVTAVDISETALDTAAENAALNGVNINYQKADVFDLLTDMKGSPYDFIILDPPAFTKSSKTARNAFFGYKEINKLAMKKLPRGGYLATCSCSHFMPAAMFEKMLKEAASESTVSLRQIEARQQSPDHPILWNVPETDYLKFYIFQVV
ncbi:MAG: class I SAM-dependent rRNA methyltransferase [Clostridia bacterium]|nr:class I SAM-dependent rRNA methyltransferase [Clostridia bacterium]